MQFDEVDTHDEMLCAFISGLTDDRSVEKAWKRTVAFMKRSGAEFLNYSYGNTFNDIRYLTTLPPEWRERYREAGYARFDHLVTHCAKRLEPLMVDARKESENQRHPLQTRNMYREVLAQGFRSCITIPLRGHTGTALGAMNLIGSLSLLDLMSTIAGRLGTYVAAAWVAHERLQILLIHETTQRLGLSRQELKCLFWLSGGLRTDQIAERLEVSRPTVDFHFKKAREKLGAATREEALTIALRAGLIGP